MKGTNKPVALIPRPDLSLAPGGRIAQVILNVDLRNSHDGLLEVAKKRGIKLQDLQPGQYLVFVNDRRDRFKLFAPAPNGRGAIIVYYKAYQGRVDREAMETIPQAFGARRRIETGEKLASRLDDELKYLRARRVDQEL